MNAESLNLSTASGATTAYVARPHEQASTAVILIQEYWGINEHIRDLAGRYAKEGYLCVAPDLYRGRIASDTAEASALMNSLQIEDGLEIIRKAIDATEETYQIKNFAITGYCMGGGYALAAAGNFPDRVVAAASYHGGRLATCAFGDPQEDPLHVLVVADGRPGYLLQYPAQVRGAGLGNVPDPLENFPELMLTVPETMVPGATPVKAP